MQGSLPGREHVVGDAGLEVDFSRIDFIGAGGIEIAGQACVRTHIRF
ncbi:MAG: hypothetical protein J7M32_04755 [Deltaproteobacteria bacterium]|nr:hypothetical protein [Deltaproteobacteria bacterium]